MVAIDHEQNLLGDRAWPFADWVVVGIIAGTTALATILTAARHGFDDTGLRAGTELAWRFAAGPFVIAMAAGPLGRIFEPFRPLLAFRRDLWLGFCASEAIYLTALLMPHAFSGEILPVEARGFFMLGAVVLVGIVAAAGPAAKMLDGWPRRALMDGAMAYFWLTYSGVALYHLYGPHRPDPYYGACLLTMLAVLLLRFAACFRAMLGGRLHVGIA